MKCILTFILIILINIQLNAQDSNSQNAGDLSNLYTISNKTGTLLNKVFYPVGKVGNVEIKILVLTDIPSGIKEIGLNLVKRSQVASGRDQFGYIDRDEVVELINSFKIIDDAVSLGLPVQYTEFIHRTRSNFTFGSYVYSATKNPEWRYFLELNPNSEDASMLMSPTQYSLFSGYIIEAHQKIQEL